MKSYEEIARSVFERRDAYIAQRKKRLATIGKISSVSAGFCCIILIALGINKAELSDVQQYKEYVGNETEPTTTPQTDTNSPPENGVIIGSDGITLPSGEVFSEPVITPDGEVIGIITPSGEYIYVIQDPTEAPSENEPTEALSEHGTAGENTESETSVNTGITGETQDNSAPTNKRPDTLLDGGMHFSTDPTEDTGDDNPPMLPMKPTEPDTEYQEPIDPTEPPSTAVPEYQESTCQASRPSTEVVTENATSIEVVTQTESSSIPEDDPLVPEAPYCSTYNKFSLSGVNGVYNVACETLSASKIGAVIANGIIIYDKDKVTYIKADIYRVNDTQENVAVAVKYHGTNIYYIAYYKAG